MKMVHRSILISTHTPFVCLPGTPRSDLFQKPRSLLQINALSLRDCMAFSYHYQPVYAMPFSSLAQSIHAHVYRSVKMNKFIFLGTADRALVRQDTI